MRNEKEINPKVSIYLFNQENPKGQMFNILGGCESDEYQALLDAGWEDTPARLDLPAEMDTGLTVEQATNADPQDIVNLCKSYGFIVMTPEQMGAEANKMASIALDIGKFSDEALIAEAEKRGLKDKAPGDEPLINRFIQSPSSLTKEELKELGKDYGLSLKMTQLEQTMIDLITAAIEAGNE